MLEVDTTTALVLEVVAVAARAEALPDLLHPEVSSPTVSGIVTAHRVSQLSTSR